MNPKTIVSEMNGLSDSIIIGQSGTYCKFSRALDLTKKEWSHLKLNRKGVVIGLSNSTFVMNAQNDSKWRVFDTQKRNLYWHLMGILNGQTGQNHNHRTLLQQKQMMVKFITGFIKDKLRKYRINVHFQINPFYQVQICKIIHLHFQMLMEDWNIKR
ncbi:unnamed protein product (macronuclear) [Paramecium tetraurelia]|uniref:Uncharacterized protein n=1 Tax=Paramecium tetraurelia TaxID=5888 RepID=A0BIW4_PARTE|nr:uncharacterized protein GSPATT00004854001 [Paramecium tetraurelia]CAK58481.1 unnamed protein product [Paramecium tetraurelia]|eukprot:XP_001425879.1 hypothetical protein (macronuclear) [Paramecium tetraurelia strain d4-2]